MVQPGQRWDMAQDYERRHWEKVAEGIVQGRSDLSWYSWKAKRTLDRLAACGVVIPPGATVAEVGSGPVGQVGFLPGNTRIALDPLMEYFEKHEVLMRERPKLVRYQRSRGEELPLPDDSCELVVIDNCLDHCEDPLRVLVEIRRVLRADGHLYLTLNVRPRPGWIVRQVAERALRLDRGHPHSYYPESLRRLIASAGFAQRQAWIQSWPASVRENWGQAKLRTLVKIATLTNEMLYEGLWSPTPKPRPVSATIPA